MVDHLEWQGASGASYSFELTPVGSAYDSQAGVYVFVRRTIVGLWQPLYVGEAEDFDGRLNSGLQRHEAWPRVRDWFATHICTLHVPEPAERQRIERDLREGLQPPCNEP